MLRTAGARTPFAVLCSLWHLERLRGYARRLPKRPLLTTLSRLHLRLSVHLTKRSNNNEPKNRTGQAIFPTLFYEQTDPVVLDQSVVAYPSASMAEPV